MCQYFTTTHLYRGCLLQETAPENATEITKIVTQGETAPEPSSISRLLRRFHNEPVTNGTYPAVVGSPDTPVSPIIPATALVADEPNFHHVTQKTYLQCPTARSNEALAGAPKERVCPDAVEIPFVEGDEEEEEAEGPRSWRRGACPVCVAAEKKVNEALTRIVIRPPPEGTTAPNLQPGPSRKVRIPLYLPEPTNFLIAI